MLCIIDFDHQSGEEVSSIHKSATKCPENIHEGEFKCVCCENERAHYNESSIQI